MFTCNSIPEEKSFTSPVFLRGKSDKDVEGEHHIYLEGGAKRCNNGREHLSLAPYLHRWRLRYDFRHFI